MESIYAFAAYLAGIEGESVCLLIGSAEWRAWMLGRLVAHALARIIVGDYAGTA